ncbi:MAG TPA: hypothetical protein VGL83_08695 [Stellaceae bacterium]
MAAAFGADFFGAGLPAFFLGAAFLRDGIISSNWPQQGGRGDRRQIVTAMNGEQEKTAGSYGFYSRFPVRPRVIPRPEISLPLIKVNDSF